MSCRLLPRLHPHHLLYILPVFLSPATGELLRHLQGGKFSDILLWKPKWETVFQFVVNRIQWWWWWQERIEKTITNCLTVDEKYCWLRICRLLHFDLMAGWQNDNPLTQFQSFLEKYLSLTTVVRISRLKTEHAKIPKLQYSSSWFFLASCLIKFYFLRQYGILLFLLFSSLSRLRGRNPFDVALSINH